MVGQQQDPGRYVSDATAIGDTYFLASYDHTAAYDISDPSNPQFLSSFRCVGSQGDVIVQDNLLFVAKEGGHTVPFNDLNRTCGDHAGANEQQRAFLYGYSTDGDSYTLNFGGNNTIPIVRGQNNSTAGVANAIQGGNEQQTISFGTPTTFDTDGDSFTLNYNGADTIPFVRGTNYTAAAITAALHGVSEVQTVALTSYDENGDSYTLNYGGVDTVPIVRGQNNTQAGIANALQGGNEQQQVTLTGFNGATQSFQVRLNGNDSVLLGAGGLAISNANIQTAVNGIAGFAGTVTSAGAGNGGFTLTFGGASANTDINAIEIVNCTGGCTSAVRENAKGGTAIAGWPAGGTVAVGTVADTGYTLTFGGSHQGTNVSAITVTNGTGTTPASGIVTETTPGTAGILPPGYSVASTTPNDNGFTLTFSGTAAGIDVLPLTITNPVGIAGQAVRETAKGSGPMAGWPAGATVTVASIGSAPVAPAHADAGITLTFGGTLAGADVAQVTLGPTTGLDDDPEASDPRTNGTPQVSHVETITIAAPGSTFTGVVIFDVSDPANPEFLKAVPVCGGGHTITKYFDKDQNRTIIYMTRGTTTGSLPAWGVNCAGLPGGRLTAVAVPMAHPKNAHVASENVLTGFAGNGCHDVNVHEEAHLITMACPNGPGLSMARLANDGLSAQLMWTFTWPGLATTHSAAISWDGKLAFVNGEPGGGSGAECAFDDDVVKPTMHILDAQTGRLLGNWALPRPQGTQGTENCTIHVLNMIPMVGKHLMATSFYNGGMAVTDFTNPKAPRELAFMDIPSAPPGTPTDFQSEGCWTGYWYNNYQYCTELSWGFHVWRMNDGAWDNTLTLDHLNGQTHDSFIKCKVSYTGGPSKAGVKGTVNATVQLFGAGPLQPGKGVKVRVSAPGFNKVLTTNTSGTASTSVTASGAGQLSVRVPVQVNLPVGCSAPSKAIAKKARR